jgi:hypothetical protein
LQRLTKTLVFCLLAAMPAAAEEISLKDGTKIVGRMTAISADKIEVETSYGKVQLKRSDILTISFPENGPAATSSNTATASDDGAAKTAAPKIDESLNGVNYVNRTGQFTRTVPPDWVLNPELRHTPDALAALSSRNRMGYLAVIREDYPGSPESYKEIMLMATRKGLGNFEELAQSSMTIDARPSLVVYYRGTLTQSNNLPVEFVSALIPVGKTFTKITVWSVEPLFHDMQPTFEKILSSYHSTAGQATASSARP